MKKSKLNRSSGLSKWVGLFLVAAGGLTACEGYDLAENDPDWLGSSIYDYLRSEGNYSNVVRMIDDLGYSDVLAKTGSKTLFVADDAAFSRFYQNNSWGVRSYEELSLAQKKQLLYGSMINNACQVAYLSSSEGPIEGDCMRRLTAASEYDSVPVLSPEQMPDNPYWQRYRDAGNSIVCMSDVTAAPMIHFIEEFLTHNLITNEDCNFLFNYSSERQPGDANVNGVMMAEQNIKCSNGFVHKMAEVLTPLPNMADLISQNANTQGYAKLLNRFCAPYRHDANDPMTREYNRLYNTNIDTLYEKRYFSERSQGGQPLDLTPDEGPVNGLLKFDPAWNQFYSTTTTTTAPNVALQENMGVMLVPSDEALERYWNEGAGKVLKDYVDMIRRTAEYYSLPVLDLYAVSGMQGAVVAARVNGEMRAFQRVSFGDHALIGSENLSSTLRANRVVALELTGVGTINNAETARYLMGVLFDNASFLRSGSSETNTSLLIQLENGLTLQMAVNGERIMACGTWACPEFIEAFQEALQ